MPRPIPEYVDVGGHRIHASTKWVCDYCGVLLPSKDAALRHERREHDAANRSDHG